MNSKFFHFLILSLLFILTQCSSQKHTTLLSQDGIINISSTNLAANDVFVLKGKWQLYWEKLVTTPEDIKQLPYTSVTVPNIWNKIYHKSLGLGYATYTSTIQLSKNNYHHPLRFIVPKQYTAMKLFINGEAITSIGTVGTTAQETVPGIGVNIIDYTPKTNTLFVAVQISNFYHRNGGFMNPITVSYPKTIHKFLIRNIYTTNFILAIFIIFSILNFIFFIYGTHRVLYLLFSLTLLSISIYNIFAEQSIFFLLLFQNLSFKKVLLTEYIIFYWIIPLFIHYIHSWFSIPITKYIVPFLYLVSFIFSYVSLIQQDTYNLSYIIFYFQYIIIIALFFLLYTSIKNLFTKNIDVKGVLYSLIILLLFTIYDVIITHFTLPNTKIALYGLLIFIITNSFSLLRLFRIEVIKSEKNLKHFNKFIPLRALKLIGYDDILNTKVGDRIEKEVCIIFIKIAFIEKTSTNKYMSKPKTFTFINSYLEAMTLIFYEHEAFIDKYFNEGILGVCPEGCEQGIKIITDIHKKINLLNQQNISKSLPSISVHSGLHYGLVSIGIIGEKNHIETTVIGDTVNLTSRIQALAIHYNSNTLITKDVYNNIIDTTPLQFRRIGYETIRGREKPIELYELLNTYPTMIQEKIEANQIPFTLAVQYFENKNYIEAKKIFTEILIHNPDDRIVKKYLDMIGAIV